MREYMSESETRHFNSILAAEGYSIGELAKDIGVSRATLSSRVNGKTDFGRCEMEKIAKILNRSPAEIFFN